MDLIRTKAELEEYLNSIKYNKEVKNIAVEALLFDPNGRLVLVLRGPKARDEVFKLEGIGGRYHDEDGTFQDSLMREIHEEISDSSRLDIRLEVKIDRLLEVRRVEFYDNKSKETMDWIVLSHLCRLEAGVPFNAEPDKHISIEYLTLEDLFKWPEDPIYKNFKTIGDHKFSMNIIPGLSKSLIVGRKKYFELYKNKLYYEAS